MPEMDPAVTTLATFLRLRAEGPPQVIEILSQAISLSLEGGCDPELVFTPVEDEPFMARLTEFRSSVMHLRFFQPSITVDMVQFAQVAQRERGVYLVHVSRKMILFGGAVMWLRADPASVPV